MRGALSRTSEPFGLQCPRLSGSLCGTVEQPSEWGLPSLGPGAGALKKAACIPGRRRKTKRWTSRRGAVAAAAPKGTQLRAVRLCGGWKERSRRGRRFLRGGPRRRRRTPLPDSRGAASPPPALPRPPRSAKKINERQVAPAAARSAPPFRCLAFIAQGRTVATRLRHRGAYDDSWLPRLSRQSPWVYLPRSTPRRVRTTTAR